LFAAAEEELSEREDQLSRELASELIRVLGRALGEETPLTASDAAVVAANLGRGEVEIALRAVLVTIVGELRAALVELKNSGAAALTLAHLEALQRAEIVRTEALRRIHEQTGRVPPFEVGVDPQGRAWDPLCVFLQLEKERTRGLDRLVAELTRTFDPVPIERGEAVAVAAWVLGGSPPPRRAGLLELARCLDDFCARAPLPATDQERLLQLARVADRERDDSAWQALFKRLWILRPRLLGEEKPRSPLERSLETGTSARGAIRPDSLEGLLAPATFFSPAGRF
jgi:hypothetical protein